MKYLWAILLVVIFGCPALAADEKNAPFVMVNGKKFFMMRNARMFSGSKKPMPVMLPRQERHNNVPVVHSPAQLAKPIQAGQPGSIPLLNAPAGSGPMSNAPGNSNAVIRVPAGNGVAAPANNVPTIPGNNTLPNGTPSGKAAADVLSIFEPQQEK